MDALQTLRIAVGLKPLKWQNPNARKISVDGREFQSIKEAAEHFGHLSNRVRNRVSEGWTL